MDLGIAGKTALVLASSQGLGLASASMLLQEGARVMISGRDEAKLQQVVAGLSGDVHYAVCDLSNQDAATQLHQAATAKLGNIDILINNTGGPAPGTTTTPDADSWRSYFDTMVLRVIEITNLCLPAMQAQGWGRILTLASSGVQQPIDNLATSNTLRAALVGWNKSLASEVAKYGITANMLLPGRIHTARVDSLDQKAADKQGKPIEEIRKTLGAAIPVGRYGKVEEFGAVAAFLVSQHASYITGSLVRCDGGLIKGV